MSVACPNCSHDSPDGSIFCQSCGFRIVAEVSEPPPGDGVNCEKCGSMNAPNMRFCTTCGNNLLAQADTAGFGSRDSQAAAEAAAAPPRPVCNRCRGVGDLHAEFCKFCGDRYTPATAAPPAKAAIVANPAAVDPETTQGVTAPTLVSAAVEQGSARLVSILNDGSDGTAYPISGQQADIGRSEGDIILGNDPYLDHRHARIRKDAEGYTLRALDSVNGVYMQIGEGHELSDSDMVLIGHQVLRFEMLDEAEIPLGPAKIRGVLTFGSPQVPRFGRLVQYTSEGVGRDVFHLYREETILGRENGDIVFTDDPFISRRHATIRFSRADNQVLISDLKSANGTAVRIRSEQRLNNGDQFRVGRHLFRFDVAGAA